MYSVCVCVGTHSLWREGERENSNSVATQGRIGIPAAFLLRLCWLHITMTQQVYSWGLHQCNYTCSRMGGEPARHGLKEERSGVQLW